MSFTSRDDVSGNARAHGGLFGQRSLEAVIFHAFTRVTRAAFLISPSVLGTAAERRHLSAQTLTETRKSMPRERNRALLDRVGQKTPRLPLTSQAEVPRSKSLPWERCVFGRHLSSRLDLLVGDAGRHRCPTRTNRQRTPDRRYAEQM